MGIETRILYEDEALLVCHKPAGIATQTARIGQRDMVSEVTGYLAGKQGAGRGVPYVGVIHRLDQPVEGILVFAKDKKAAGELSRQMAADEMGKYYQAVVCGKEIPAEGELVDYLLKDGRNNTSRVVPKEVKDAKLAKLTYETKQKTEGKMPDTGETFQTALLRIHLLTGRHHQIRVQMANAGMSILGDHKYADPLARAVSESQKVKEIALCAAELYLKHPGTGKKLHFRIEPEGKIFHELLKVQT